jgi:hypothetical protein
MGSLKRQWRSTKLFLTTHDPLLLSELPQRSIPSLEMQLLSRDSDEILCTFRRFKGNIEKGYCLQCLKFESTKMLGYTAEERKGLYMRLAAGHGEGSIEP